MKERFMTFKCETKDGEQHIFIRVNSLYMTTEAVTIYYENSVGWKNSATFQRDNMKQANFDARWE